VTSLCFFESVPLRVFASANQFVDEVRLCGASNQFAESQCFSELVP